VSANQGGNQGRGHPGGSGVQEGSLNRAFAEKETVGEQREGNGARHAMKIHRVGFGRVTTTVARGGLVDFGEDRILVDNVRVPGGTE